MSYSYIDKYVLTYRLQLLYGVLERAYAHHSLTAQAGYYSKQAKYHPEWTFLSVYADIGLTNTNTNCPEFTLLIDDGDAGRIDLIITKSVSRFARNTVDRLVNVRKL